VADLGAALGDIRIEFFSNCGIQGRFFILVERFSMGAQT
jgi:hypothetical protein